MKINGSPISNKNVVNTRIPNIEITPPSELDINVAIAQSNIAALLLDVNIDLIKQGELTILDNGTSVYRLSLDAKNAKALNLYYDNFKIPAGGKLFIYSPDQKQLHGAYSALNNSVNNHFTHDYITGDQLILEYNAPPNSNLAEIQISQVGYFLKDTEATAASAYCEVNVNCSEGDDWQDEKKGVVRLLIKSGSQTSWCSGSVINTTDTNCLPYILSAEHCTNGSNQTDNDGSIVYFNFESSTCLGSTGNATNSMIGFDIISTGPASGSDFILMKLKNSIPTHYNAYFNGWKNDDAIFINGVSIHHPAGDIKKISTYSTPLITKSISGGMTNGYWGVTWNSTTNGHGITEGGSSGSPIFNKNGLIVGTLTGGSSFCATPTKTDFYGKLSAHWDQNGSDSTKRLVDWLDPDGTGITELEGSYKSCPDSTVIEFINKIKVWPNPASIFINIEMENTIVIEPTISIYDLRGKIVFKEKLESSNAFLKEIPIYNLSNGNYIISIVTSTSSNHQSIIIAR
jgi:hypothetical protein